MNKGSLDRVKRWCFVLWGLLALLCAGPVQDVRAQSPLPPWYPAWQALAGNVDLLVVRVYYDGVEQLRALTARNEPWEVDAEGGYALLDVSRGEYERLIAEGFRVEVDQKLTKSLSTLNTKLRNQVNGIPGYLCYRTVEETFATAENLVATYPGLVSWIDIGDSWEKMDSGGTSGYDLMVLRITNSAVPGPKPKLFAMTALHAREYATAELNTRFAEYLLENYGVDPDVTWIVDYHEIHLLLIANPDGRKQAETGLSWRKNTNTEYCSPTSNYRGADLNRNFEFQWGCCGGSSGSECDQTYRGPDPASEPETQAIQTYVRSQFPDLRDEALTAAAPITTSGVFLDIHSYSQLVLWPWGFTEDLSPNSTELQTFGRKIAYFSHYKPQQSNALYYTDGTTNDFGYGELGLPSYVIEIGSAFFQPCGIFEHNILPDNLQSLLYAAKVLRTPYITPAGPDAADVAVSESGIVAGEMVTLTATLDDTRYQHSNGVEPTQTITAAVYSIDTPPWELPAPALYPLVAADGAFDTPVEAALATIDTTGLSVGRHTLFVQAQDADGNWGAVSAVFLYIVDPVTSPVITGYVRDAGTNAPLVATVSTGPFKALGDDPATGAYMLRVISGTYTLQAEVAGYGISTAEPITLQDGQVLQQDFYLYPICTFLDDDMESGNPGWSTGCEWAITSESAHSPSQAWSDSPNDDYSNGARCALTSPILDFGESLNTTLSFWHTYDLENRYDFGYVEYSVDSGSTWTQIAAFNGENQTTWQHAIFPLPDLDGEQARIRFYLYSDLGTVEDGWYIDDIVLSGAGPACAAPTSAPTATFEHSVPSVVNAPVTFTSAALGTPPLQYTWDFGDGSGTSQEPHPSHSYATAGTFSVTLLVTNSLGSAQVSRVITITPEMVWERAVYVNGVPAQTTPLYVESGDVVTVANRVWFNPPDSIAMTLVETYTASLAFGGWDADAGDVVAGSTAFTWTLDSITPQTWYTLTGSYEVLGGTWEEATLGDVVLAEGMESYNLEDVTTFLHRFPRIGVTPQSIEAHASPGEQLIYTLGVSNTGTGPLVWTLSEQPPADWLAVMSGTLPLPDTLPPQSESVVDVRLDATALADGVYTTTLVISSNDPDEPEVTLEVRLAVCTAPAGVAFIYQPVAPQAGEPLTMSAVVTQGTAPLTWTWSLGDGEETAGQEIVHTYALSGTYAVGLRATNACGSAVVTRPLFVPGQAAIAVQPQAVQQTLFSGESGSAEVRLSNSGTHTLIWSLAGEHAAWLSVAPDEGALAPGRGVSLTLGLDATAFQTGTHATAFTIAGNDPERPQVTVPVTLTVLARPITAAELSLVMATSVYTGMPVTFEARLFPADVTVPFSYTLDAGAVQTASVATFGFTRTFATTGTHGVELAAWNVATSTPVTATASVTVLARPAIITPLETLSVTQYPASGDIYTDTLITWTLTLGPLTATAPYLYTIDDGLPLSTEDNSVVYTRTGESEGAHNIVFSAWNLGMSRPLSETLAYEVIAREVPFMFYLPFVLRF